jgi:hypothetical protein
MSDEEKRALVDAILAIVEKTPEDKLQPLKDAVSSIEPPELKAEVADAAKEKTPEDGVAEITAALMKLDEAKLMELKSALESVPKEGGDLLDEQQEFKERQKERQAAKDARRAAAAKTAIPKGVPPGNLLKKLGYVFSYGAAGLLSIAGVGGRTRRRRTRRA